MATNRFRVSTAVTVIAVAAVGLLAAGCAGPTPSPAAPTPSPAGVTPLPAGATPPATNAAFDYQIGGPYTPSPGVTVVSRDYTATPAPGLYNICYVNAFQTQPGAEGEWDRDLLLRESNGALVPDTEWNETLLDLTTPDKRQRIAAKVSAWIDTCARKGFRAVEPDNFDSYTRSHGLLTADDAQEYIRLLSAHAHGKGLAIAQKNAAELAEYRRRNGFDFAVAEECGQNDECGTYADAFDNHVLVIEYTDAGLAAACSGFGNRLSIVERDKGVSVPNSGEYRRKTCP